MANFADVYALGFQVFAPKDAPEETTRIGRTVCLEGVGDFVLHSKIERESNIILFFQRKETVKQ